MKNEQQYKATKEWITRFENAIAVMVAKPCSELSPAMQKLQIDAAQSQLDDLRAEARAYEREQALSTLLAEFESARSIGIPTMDVSTSLVTEALAEIERLRSVEAAVKEVLAAEREQDELPERRWVPSSEFSDTERTSAAWLALYETLGEPR